jgi:hypothetical protein
MEGMGDVIEEIPFPVKPVGIKKEELSDLLNKYGKWQETVTFKEVKKELEETIDIGGETDKPLARVKGVALEALRSRGWTEAEATQILERIRGAETAEQRQKIITKTIEKSALTTILREFGLDIDDEIVNVWRPNIRTGPNEAIFYDKGKARLYELDPALHQSVMASNPEALQWYIKLLAFPAKTLRAGATTFSPEFAARNPFRDQLTAFIQSKYGYIPFIDLMRGVAHMTKQTEAWKRYNASGAAHAALVSMDRNYLKKNLRGIVRRRSTKDTIRHPLETLQIVSELMEEATRVGEYLRAEAKETGGIDGLLKAGGAAREVTLDFQKKGSKMVGFNMITAFWNARLEGAVKMGRSFRDQPGTTMLRSFLGITVPSLLLWWAQKDDPYYQELPHWQRALFWNIITHNEDGTLKRVWKIPKPFEWGILFGSVPEMFLDSVYQDDPEAIREAMTALWEGVWPGIVPTGLSIWRDISANWAHFYERPIVPRGKEDLEPVLQTTAYTSETVKLLAEGMHRVPGVKKYASPAKIEYLIVSMTASLGRMTLEGIDEILTRAGVVDVPPDPSMTLSDIPGIRAFASRFPSANTKSVEMFYKRYTEAQRKWESAKQRAGVRGLGIEIPQPIQLQQYRAVAKMLSWQRKAIQGVYKAENMTPAQKREALDRYYSLMINTARAALGKKQIRF